VGKSIGEVAEGGKRKKGKVVARCVLVCQLRGKEGKRKRGKGGGEEPFCLRCERRIQRSGKGGRIKGENALEDLK